MPRPNPGRSLRTERDLARRISHERERLGMSYAGLAERMTRAGCPINQSALYKIEKGEPPRGISVSELVALSDVFGVPVQELLLPVDLVLTARTRELLSKWDEAVIDAREASSRAEEAWTQLRSHLAEHPAAIERLEEVAGSWAEWHFPEAQRGHKAALLLMNLTDDRTKIKQYMREAEAQFAAMEGDRG
jgi:transcriptional regulator with XRE-family HTH domain